MKMKNEKIIQKKLENKTIEQIAGILAFIAKELYQKEKSSGKSIVPLNKSENKYG